jgi:hypothetical protein
MLQRRILVRPLLALVHQGNQRVPGARAQGVDVKTVPGND